jgi:hypothetical protein
MESLRSAFLAVSRTVQSASEMLRDQELRKCVGLTCFPAGLTLQRKRRLHAFSTCDAAARVVRGVCAGDGLPLCSEPLCCTLRPQQGHPDRHCWSTEPSIRLANRCAVRSARRVLPHAQLSVSLHRHPRPRCAPTGIVLRAGKLGERLVDRQRQLQVRPPAGRAPGMLVAHGAAGSATPAAPLHPALIHPAPQSLLTSLEERLQSMQRQTQLQVRRGQQLGHGGSSLRCAGPAPPSAHAGPPPPLPPPAQSQSPLLSCESPLLSRGGFGHRVQLRLPLSPTAARPSPMQASRRQRVDVQFGRGVFLDAPQEVRARLWYVLLENPELAAPIRVRWGSGGLQGGLAGRACREGPPPPCVQLQVCLRQAEGLTVAPAQRCRTYTILRLPARSASSQARARRARARAARRLRRGRGPRARRPRRRAPAWGLAPRRRLRAAAPWRPAPVPRARWRPWRWRRWGWRAAARRRWRSGRAAAWKGRRTGEGG